MTYHQSYPQKMWKTVWYRGQAPAHRHGASVPVVHSFPLMRTNELEEVDMSADIGGIQVNGHFDAVCCYC